MNDETVRSRGSFTWPIGSRPVPEVVRYRPDIDGLRAVAVLAVVAFHLGLPVPGGFVGVDVFFVISGYLIGAIVSRQVRAGTFTYGEFYRRRLRRILPALIAMLIATVVCAYRYLLPGEMVDFGRSLLAANFSVSNFYFWRQSGYFDAPMLTKPLLHTWSLSVEEQFYICLPPLLASVKSWASRRIATVLGGVCAISIVISTLGAYRYPAFAFYLLPSRAWELILGTIIALEEFPRISSRLLSNLAGASGVGLIVASYLVLRPTTPFPGVAATLPCLGTALIILSGRECPTVARRILSIRPAVAIGKISYSLYLWHWPIIVFSGLGMRPIQGLTRHQSQLMMFGLSIVAATLSWFFVEEPFRRRRPGTPPRRVFAVAGAGVTVVAVIGAALWLSRGLPGRYSPEARQIASYADLGTERDFYRRGRCFMLSRDWPLQSFDSSECLKHGSNRRSIVLVGDSHAAHLWWGLHTVYPEADVMQATSVGCKPVLHQRPRQYPGCARLMTFMLRDYLPTHPVNEVIIEAHWEEDDMESLSETIAWLRSQHVPVVVMGPMLQYDAPLPRLLAFSLRDHDPLEPRHHRIAMIRQLDEEMAARARDQWKVPYASLLHALCADESCIQYAAPGVPLQADYGHVTEAGSVVVARKLRDVVVTMHQQ